MDYYWDNPHGNWIERGVTAQGRPGRFKPVHDRDRAPVPRHRLPDAARLAGARRAGCGCAPCYPPFFDFCPNCGRELDRPDGDAAPWFGAARDARLPRHVPHGLQVALMGEPAGQRRMPAPPNAEVSFASASFGHAAPSLLALAPRRGVLQYWEPCAAQWLLLDGAAHPGFLASRHAWLPVKDNAILTPTDAGLAALSVDLLGESFQLDIITAGSPAAAPGQVAGSIAAPMASGGVAFSPGAAIAAPQSGYQAPFSYDGMLWWLHPDGLLRYLPGEGGRWQPWPHGWRPCLALCGPTQSRDGRLWLCGHDGSAYSFVELGQAAPERVEVDGLRAGWANFIFRRGHEVRGEPWDEPDIEDPHQHDSLVIPLLRAFNNDRARPSGLVLRLPSHAGRAEDLDMAAEAHIEWIGAANRVLDRCARLQSPLEVRAFLHDGAAWLHHPSWSQMRGWSLAR
jgi:hypothetical protein